jgi:hypothetical protein
MKGRGWRIESAIALTAMLVLTSAASAAATPPPVPSAASPTCAWSVVASPTGTATFANRLEDVVALSTNDAWAVGWLGGFAAIQRWNGTSWANVSVPPVPGASQSRLLGVDAAGPNDVWAVGYAIVNDGYKTLTMHWNGSVWSVASSPNLVIPGSEVINALNDVTVVSSNDVWAVGGDIRNFNANISEAVLMRWNGTQWTLSTPPAESLSTSDASRYAVDAVSSSDVWALGDIGELRWDGTRWNYAGISTQATVGVTALAANDVWAVGTTPGFISEFEVFPADPFATHWNGAGWTRTSLPKIPGSKGFGDTFTRAVDATGGSDVWAVGMTGRGTYVAHFNGAAWSLVTTPDAVTTYSNVSIANELFGVSALTPTDVWAVGFYRNASLLEFPLILHYTCDGVPPDPGSVGLTSLSLGAASVVAGASTTGTVTLTGAAPAGGTLVSLASSAAFAAVPSIVLVPAGSSSATFTVTTSRVRAAGTATITASLGGSSLSQTLTVTRPGRR